VIGSSVAGLIILALIFGFCMRGSRGKRGRTGAPYAPVIVYAQHPM
jgi:hypothetical protein